MLCAISGKAPEEPVVSPQGYIFERSLIEKFIEANGKCPITGEPLTVDQLIAVKTPQIPPPRPPTATSIPGLLQIFQNEWDGLMLETFALRQNLESMREELSRALYQNDAAARVIARLMKERDDARRALAAAGGAGAAQAGGMDVEGQLLGVTADVVARITDTAKQLTQSRKKRQISQTLISQDKVSSFSNVFSVPLHSTSKPGILCIDTTPLANKSLAVTGGADGSVVIFDPVGKTVVHNINAHSKAVRSVMFAPFTYDRVLTSSADGSAKLIDPLTGQLLTSLETGAELVGASLHPSGDYAITCGTRSWSFWELRESKRLQDFTFSSAATTCIGHPDGALFAVGTAAGTVLVFDLRSQTEAASFVCGAGPVCSLAFSENGFYFATCTEDDCVKVWDLRKGETVYDTKVSGARAVAFDYSGQYLSIAGAEMSVLSTKTWETLVSMSGSQVAALKFGPDASYVATVSKDRHLRMYATL